METHSDVCVLTGHMNTQIFNSWVVESVAWVELPFSNTGFQVLVGRRGFSVSLPLRRCVKSIQKTHCEYFPWVSLAKTQFILTSNMRTEISKTRSSPSLRLLFIDAGLVVWLWVFIHKGEQNILCTHVLTVYSKFLQQSLVWCKVFSHSWDTHCSDWATN